jgi:glutaredoxin
MADEPSAPGAGAPGTEAPGARIVLYTRAGCHLCDEARTVLARVQLSTGVDFAEVDISGDPDLTAEYGDRIPVVVLDGREHGYWRVEEARLLRDIAR